MKALLENIYGDKLEKYNKINASLPLYLSDNREFYEVILFGVKFVVVDYITMERLNVSQLIKYEKKYYDYFKVDIVYGFPKVSTFQRKSLIKNSISFISDNEQVFIPFIGSYFSKCQREDSNKPFDKFSPTTQLIALFFVYSEKNKKYSKKSLAEKFEISAMSITRATRELHQIGVLEEEKIGNEIFAFCEKEKKDMLSIIKPYLINPVQKTLYVEDTMLDKNDLLKAGEYSLAYRSALGYPKYEEYALRKNSAVAKNIIEYDYDLNVQKTLIKIQKWKYDPNSLGSNGMVDPISLICSFQKEEDERIQMSLDEVKEEIEKWQIIMN